MINGFYSFKGKYMELLETTPGNDAGDILLIEEETDTEIYYTDGWDRWVWLGKNMRGIFWELAELEAL